MPFARITVDPNVLGGVPTVRGFRFPVATVVAMIAVGVTVEEILAEHLDLESDDIAECLRYAALAVQERELPSRQPARGLCSTPLSRRYWGSFWPAWERSAPRCCSFVANLDQVAHPHLMPTPPRRRRRGTGPTYTPASPPSPTSSRALVHFFGVRAEQAPPSRLNEHLHD